MEPKDNPRLKTFIDELLKWNKRVNLIGRNSEAGVWENHVADSLALLPFLSESPAPAVVDIGSGGGFPAIPLSILLPEKKFVLTDVNGKKLAFLEYAVKKLGLNAEVADMNRGLMFQGDCAITSRAYGGADGILRWARRHAPGASLFLLLKGREESAAAEMEKTKIKNYEIIPLAKGCIVKFGPPL